MPEFVVLELPERLDIAAAESTHLEMENVLQQSKPIQLVADQVSKVDTAGVQLLTCFFDEASSHHLDIKWKAVSDTVLETFTFLSLSNRVGLEDFAGAEE